MKFNFDVECTPEEARRFFGLPDVLPMQKRMMEELEQRMADNIRAMEPEAFIKSWFPTSSMQGWQDMQKMFWSQMGMKNMTGDAAEGSDPAAPSKKKA
jgi:hypothetical protein